MKDFEASFFKTENFILSTKKYGSFTNNNVEIKICYNVNDDFIPVMIYDGKLEINFADIKDRLIYAYSSVCHSDNLKYQKMCLKYL